MPRGRFADLMKAVLGQFKVVRYQDEEVAVCLLTDFGYVEVKRKHEYQTRAFTEARLHRKDYAVQVHATGFSGTDRDGDWHSVSVYIDPVRED